MLKIKSNLLFLLLAICTNLLYAQDIKISRDINIKNDFAYDLLSIGEEIYFYRDKGFEYYFDVFDKDLNYKKTVEVKLEHKKAFIESIHTIDTTLNIYYSYRKEGFSYIKALKYDNKMNAIDTLEILNTEKSLDIGAYRTVLSEDKSKLVLFNFDKKEISVLVINTSDFNLMQQYNFVVPNYEAIAEFEEIVVSNEGDVFLLFEKNNTSWEKAQHFFRVVSLSNGTVNATEISSEKHVNSGVKMCCDNKNKRLAIGGLWSSKSEIETEGFFTSFLSFEELKNAKLFEINRKAYDENIVKDFNGVDRKSKNNQLNDFYLKDILLRQDGGVVLIAEFQREYARRNSVPSFDRSTGSRSYMEYYSEDLALFSINPDGNQLWRKLLFKKQYSQDDDGIYSSYFMMKVPSHLHIIFNDEIKNANTVSEYTIDPIGNYKRNSLLSTEYKNLKLRFKDGVQTSNKSFVVPSEKSSKINLVKFTL
jgi:hypothetical protein